MSDLTPCVLAFMAHPDDIEFTCAGTLARLYKEYGWRVAMGTSTPGDCGSMELRPEDISRTRLGEARRSAAMLDADFYCIGGRDLFVFYDRPHLQRVIEVVRTVRPTMVVTHSPSDYLLDHEVTSTLVRAAVFCASCPNIFTDAADPQPATRFVPHVYYADPMEGHDIFGKDITPDFVVDITNTIDLKEQMLCCHASQREWLRAQHGLDEYVMGMRSWAAERGKTIGRPFGEGFRLHQGHGYPHEDILRKLLVP
ncbi:MAG: PIG-L family deacetylase [Armatimonadetes bacterium]|nr:PIG-L family deacetylase [Armatimonadota bacterium]